MSKDVLKLALEALEWITQQRTGGMIQRKATEATTAIKQALEQPLQEPVAFFDWYDNAHWGNEDFKEGCHRSWNAAIKYTTPPAQEIVCSTGLCHYKPAAPVQPVASLKEADVLMIAEAHNIDPSTKGLYGFYIDCISSQPAAQRPWVGLTNEQRSAIIRHHSFADDIIRVTAAKLKELNT
jgi:hypothetical protein